MLRNRSMLSLAVAALAVAHGARAADDTAQKQSLEELRNTVVNLLQALVDKGLLTREQAQQLVKQAQDKAAAEAATATAKSAAQAKEEENAVRVPYVPQIVKDEISKQVAQEVKPAVVADVVQQAKKEQWGVPAALPAWLSRVRVFGDLTLRGEGDFYPGGNSFNQLLNYNTVNAAGGITKTPYPFLDTTYNQYRARLRARLGVEGDLTDTLRAYIRLSSGSLTQIAGSESQTLGQYYNRYSVGIDQAFMLWDSSPRGTLPVATLEGGRIPNPWLSPTELVWARDLTFEGVAGTERIGWGSGGADRSHIFLTYGAFPILMAPTQASENKTMVGAQLGANLRMGGGSDYLRFAGAYYNFHNVQGTLNPPFSMQYNYTAPAFVQFGNTMFNIANQPTDPTTQLFALAAQFRIVDVAANYEHRFSRYSLAFSAEASRNIAYNLGQIEALSGQTFTTDQDDGYVAELSFGDPVVDRHGLWRAAIGYRHVGADAVIDAWTDADFHGGGTNAYGYYFWTSFGIVNDVWLRLRYLSADVLTGPRYGYDIVQLDLNARF
jgi:Putative porin